MSLTQVLPDPAHPLAVGSFGSARALASAEPGLLATECDLAEIRLDLLVAEGVDCSARPWAHLAGFPLLFTARRKSEGGAGDLQAAERHALLLAAAGDAALVDIELLSVPEMPGSLALFRERNIPWIASWHDFEGREDSLDRIAGLAEQAAALGAACFKAAVRLHTPGDLARLAACLAAPLPLPLSLMGMGPLAPVSRLLAAQCGSVLNYGYTGDVPTAPGQWSARQLREGMRALQPLR